MRKIWHGLAGMGAALAISCAAAGGGAGAAARGEMGDLAVEDGSVGGISEVPNPTPQMAKRSGKPLETLQRGHSTYMLKCGECHAYMLPENLFIDEWQDAVPKMISHAGLEPSAEQDVLAYVLAVKQAEGSE